MSESPQTSQTDPSPGGEASGAAEPTSPSRTRRHWTLRIFAGFFLSLGVLLALLSMAIFWVLPRLGEQGTLNSVVENLLRESLNIPVRIDRVETDPLSRLAITHLTSVRTADDRRFRFACDRLSILYSPLDLLEGRIEQLTLVRPRLRIDLDANLEQVFSVPDSLRQPEFPGGKPSELEPFIGHLVLERGKLDLVYAGETFRIEDLAIEVYGLGGREQQAFTLQARGLGSRFSASGQVLPEKRPDGTLAYRVLDARLELERLELAPVLGLLRLLWPGLEIEGAVDLKGEVAGTWPDELRVKLASRLDASGLRGEAASLDSGELSIDLGVTLLDAARQVDFTLGLQGRGQVRTTISPLQPRFLARLGGRFEQEVEGGRLKLDDSSGVNFESFGQVKVSGEVASLLDEPRLELDLALDRWELSRFPLGEIERILPSRLSPGWLAALEGQLSLDLGLRGHPDAPVVSLSGELTPLVDTTPVSWPERVEFGVERITGLVGVGSPGLESVSLRVEGLSMSQPVPGVEGEEPAFPRSGKLDLVAHVPRWTPDRLPREFELDVNARDLAFVLPDELALTEGARLAASLKATGGPIEGRDGLELEGSMRFSTPYLILGGVGLELEAEPVVLRGKASWRPSLEAGDGEQGHVDLAGQLETALTGRVELGGSLELRTLDDRLTLDDLRILATAAALPTTRLYQTLVLSPLVGEVPALEASTLTGESRLAARLELGSSGPRLELDLRGSDLAFALPRAGLKIEGLEARWPLDPIGDSASSGEPRTGFLEFRSLEFGELELRARRVEVEKDGEAYRFSPVEIEELGGRLRLEALRWLPSGPGAGFTGSAVVRDLDVRRALSRALGVPLKGELDGRVERFSLAEDRLEVEGDWTLRAFGGQLEIGDVAVDYLGQPYRVLRIEAVDLEEVRLLEVGEVFGLGLLSGVLEGTVRDLQFSSDSLFAFEVDLETVPRDGVDQTIDLEAMESLYQLLSGYLFGLESFLFREFGYRDFGFWGKLEGGRFQLRGKTLIDGVEYIMYSPWYYFPGVHIVNSRPGKTYSWSRIVRNVKALIRAREAPAEDRTSQRGPSS